MNPHGVGLTTGWYPPEVGPARMGCYETLCGLDGVTLEEALRDNDSADLLHWSGLVWCAHDGGPRMLIQERYWRGLTERAT